MLEDPPASQNRRLKADDPTVIILSSSLLTDRMFRYSGFTDVLAANSKPHLWATSVRNPENQDWCVESSLKVEPFPQIQPLRNFRTTICEGLTTTSGTIPSSRRAGSA